MSGMMKLWRLMVVLVVLGYPVFVEAEFYKYVDQDGRVQFTDNLANVPLDQRPGVQEYEDAPLRTTREKPKKEKGDGEKTSGTEATEAGAEVENAVERRLEEEGERLREEYEALMEEKGKLDQAASKRLGSIARKRLVGKIKDFNARIADYEKRREAHNKAVEAYNAKLTEEAEAQASSPPAENPAE